jgi:hypothetical protein
VYQGGEAETADVEQFVPTSAPATESAEPTLRQSTTSSEDKSADVSDIVKKWSKK